jgi:GAF domain-containing protein
VTSEASREQTIGETARMLISASGPRDVAARVVQACAEVVDCDGAVLGLFDRARDRLVALGGYGLRGPVDQIPTIAPGQGMYGMVFGSGEAMLTTDYLRDPAFVGPGDAWAREEGIVTQIAVPLIDRNRAPMGVLGVFRRTVRPFADIDLDAVLALAAAAALGVRNVRMSEAIHALNNLLATALFGAEILLEEDQDAVQRREHLQMIRRAALEARDIVRAIRQTRDGGTSVNRKPRFDP